MQAVRPIGNEEKQISSEILKSTYKMASTKQCISCNREMPIASESCVCGHVLSDTKSLEGKRYSGYREELYSRLEIRRILKDHEKPKRPRLKQKNSNEKQDITSSIHKSEMKRRHKRRSPRPVEITAHTRHRPSQTFQMKKNISQPTNFDDNPELWYLNPRFNFTDALADINKRLISQTSFWIKL